NNGVGANGHVIFYDDFAKLGNGFVGAVFLRGKAKPITADNGASMDRTVFSNHRVGVYLHAGMQDGVITNGYIVTDVHLRIDFYIMPNRDMVTDIRESASVYIVPQR